MKQIIKGKNNVPLGNIAIEHFCRLNFNKNGQGSKILEHSPISYIQDKIDESINCFDTYKTKFFEKFLEDEFDLLFRVITSNITEIDALILEVENLMSSLILSMNDLKEDFEDIFKYTNWRGTQKSRWLYESLGLDYCPYCNAEKIYSTKEGDLFVEIDHYYSKAEYPYLSLSFYNLIPSCERCNGPLCKGARPFKLTSHLHPYHDDFHSKTKFLIAEPILRRDDRFKIEISRLVDEERLESYISDLKLESRYNIQQVYDVVLNLWEVGNSYTEEKIQECIHDDLLEDVNSKRDVLFYLNKIPLDDIQINNYEYGKLKFDLASTEGFNIS